MEESNLIDEFQFDKKNISVDHLTGSSNEFDRKDGNWKLPQFDKFCVHVGLRRASKKISKKLHNKRRKLKKYCRDIEFPNKKIISHEYRIEIIYDNVIHQ